MIDLRFIERDGKKVLQWRQVPCMIGWIPGTDGGDHAVFQLMNPVRLRPSENWTEWEDIRLEDQPRSDEGNEKDIL